MTLTGILKNIILVVASILIWNTHIAALQFFGYAIALAGLVYYSLGWATIVDKSSELVGWVAALAGGRGAYTLVDGSRLTPTMRKSLVVGLVATVASVLVVGLYWNSSLAEAPSAVVTPDAS